MKSEARISDRRRRMLKQSIASLFRASDGKRSPKKRLLLLLLNGSRLSRSENGGRTRGGRIRQCKYFSLQPKIMQRHIEQHERSKIKAIGHAH
ncbi:hypothetical protein CHARACLAT_017126 [Characodon lateralis]|uniref:Uncharacterized protein n=1 Tax=Characodon lateralis TaxID=208331 RepID=A0ABU7D7H4_9TELE|nr:hypothetical protein [Characodon lateralis]